MIKDYAKYNLWVTRIITEWLRANPTEALDREIQSSFPSINKTLYHMLGAQVWWLSVLEGKEMTDLPKENYMEALEKSSDALWDYVSALDEEALQATRKIKLRIGEGDLTQAEIIMHVINHSSYHRGNIITMGHQLGFTKAPWNDYLRYVLEEKAKA